MYKNENSEKIKNIIDSNWDNIVNSMEMSCGLSMIILTTWVKPLKLYDVIDTNIYFYVDDNLGNYGVEFLHKRGIVDYLCQTIRDYLMCSGCFTDLDYDKITIYIEEKNKIISIINGSNPVLSEDMPYSAYYYDSIKKANLNPKYTFDNFVVGESNKHAHATCIAVADYPSQDSFNPLFLYGGSGLGKTHLIQSIGHYIIQHNDNLKVLYVSSETFTNEIIEAIRNSCTDDFRAKYRQVDVLIIDDIQEIIGRERTQEEFFNTFNFLYESKKQIIISSDRPPKELKHLDERLRSRFEGGVPIDIHAPDYETRMAILRHKAKANNLNIPEDVLIYIAENIVSNVRELEGALNKIGVYSKLSKETVDLKLAKESLKDFISKDVPISITPALILSTVSAQLGVSVADITSMKRSKDITNARQIVMYISRNLTDKSLKNIGETVGGRDHATVHSGILKIEEKMKSDESIRSTVNIIINKLTNK